MSWTARMLAESAAADRVRAHAFVAGCPAGHFHQYPGWPRVAGRAAESPRLLVAERSGEIGLVAQLTLARVGGLGPVVAHVDRGPVIGDAGALSAALPVLIQEARGLKAASLRLAPYVTKGKETVQEALRQAGFRPARTRFGYDRTVEADLCDDHEALLRSFRKGHRSAVKQAQRAGVQVVEGGPPEAEIFAGFYNEMVARKGASPQPKGYFQRLQSFLSTAPEAGFFSMSRLDGRHLGGLFVMRHGERAIYAYGASPELEPGLPRTHILHYEAMLRCRALGCRVYDMGGCSAGSGTDGQRSPRQNVNMFKKGFARREVDLLPEQELILRPLHHRLVEVGRRMLGSS
jgi:lipid II:glycine glycyltransferase (peptidoglycan interpeptide bridge formation enzyme)